MMCLRVCLLTEIKHYKSVIRIRILDFKLLLKAERKVKILDVCSFNATSTPTNVTPTIQNTYETNRY